MKLTRRDFLRLSALGIGSAVIANSLTGCVSPSVFGPMGKQNTIEKTNAVFTHGVASGDPLSDRVILWTRATPLLPEVDDEVILGFEVALDQDFSRIVTKGMASTTQARDHTVKVDVTGLSPDTTYYYRFLTRNNVSAFGRTRTLPVGAVDKVKLIVVSCAYYSAGYFNVYAEAAKVSDANAMLHLGDYIYEYGPGVYADEEAVAMDRVMLPAHEIVQLDDYRQRYAQTRSDTDLQNLHASMAMISVWDDHEVSNDTWSSGAENHSDSEGDFDARRFAALQAYAEWMPIRSLISEDIQTIQRSFHFGDLVNLSLLDTRLIAREKQLDYAEFTDKTTGDFDGNSFLNHLNEPDRSLLGPEQLQTVQQCFQVKTKWHVLGQQVLMASMHLPMPIVTQQISAADYAKLASKSPETRSTQEQAILDAPSIPYNLDAWDGYPEERKKLLNMAAEQGINLVVLAGDTHNAWASDLLLNDKPVGVEFATSSVTSPGLEKYINSTEEDEKGTVEAIAGLKYCNMVERGYLSVSFTQTEATAEWIFVDTVKSKNYRLLENRRHRMQVKIGQNKLTS